MFSRIEKVSAVWQVGIYILGKSIETRFDSISDVEELCKHLGVSRSASYEAANKIAGILNRESMTPQKPNSILQASQEAAKLEKEVKKLQFEVEVLKFEKSNPDARVQSERNHFTSAYKQFIDERRRHCGLTLEEVSRILHLSIDSLKKFSQVEDPPLDAPKELPEAVRDMINLYLRSESRVKSVKEFWNRFQAQLAPLGMSYQQVVSWLSHLGFVSPKGIFLKNKGVDHILRFRPNQVWGTDGKRIRIIFAGQVFDWVWQCLVDCKTTVIVGGLIAPGETTENLLEAIRTSQEKTGVSPLALVLDNRLSEDMPAIRSYLQQFGIEIIHTFPGNSKSNGITEGNFGVFERWVGGEVKIEGNTPEELSRSVAQAVVEIFTQLRNHASRKKLGNKSATEVANQIPKASPEEESHTKAKIKELADRFKNEESQPLVSEAKKAAIQQAVEATHPPDPERLVSALTRTPVFTADLILQSIAIFKVQKNKNPHKNLNHRYFAGILRKLTDQQNVEWLNTELNSVYSHHWDTLKNIHSLERAQSLGENPVATCTRLATDYLNMPVPAFATRVLLDLKEAFLLASQGSISTAQKLREKLSELVIQSRKTKSDVRQKLLRKIFEWENFVLRYSLAQNAH